MRLAIKQFGFTLVELIMMMVVVGVLAAYVAAKLDFASYDADGCAETLKASIRMAQKLAIAKRVPATPVAVTVGAGCAVTVGADSYPALNGVSVSGAGSVTFNGLGQPSVGGTPLTAVKAFTVSGGAATRWICLEPETGYVHAETSSCA